MSLEDVQLDTNGYYALGVPAYLAVIGVEWLLLRRRGIRSYSLPESLANMSAGLGEVTLGVFIGPALVMLYEWAYRHLCIVHPFHEGSLASWVFAFLLADFCYYVYHRASHRVGAFWAIHGVHHQARVMNVTVALRHPWLSDSYSAPFYALCPIMGIPTAQFFVAISFISFYAFTVHSRTFRRPGLFVLVTPQTHIVHHARNPRYIDKNFGAMFTLWDRIFGTHVEVVPEDPPDLGTLSGCDTYSGARAQWIGLRDLLARARYVKGPVAKVVSFLRPPAWRPEGAPAGTEKRASEGKLGIGRGALHVGAFVAVLMVAAELFLNAETLHMPIKLLLGGAVFGSLYLTGRAVDRATSTPTPTSTSTPTSTPTSTSTSTPAVSAK
jgi:sterol desaturase/sphingolipid hydroxylase (fatty acid hydroxylase superfamily)